MKIAVISSLSDNTADIVRECSKRSIECTVFEPSSLTLDTLALATDPFFSYDAYLFRGYTKSYHLIQILAQHLDRQGKVVIDQTLAGGFVPSKLHEAIVYKDKRIAHPRTYFMRTYQPGIVSEYPVVVKDVDSQRGKGVRLCESDNELKQEIDTNGSTIIAQEYIRMTFDLRIICVGHTVVGAIKRYVIDGDFRSNVSLGSSVEAHRPTDTEKDLALRAHTAMGYDISGVDIGYRLDGLPFVIETNITPEWQGFKSATGIAVESHVIDYIESRYAHAKS